MANEGGVFDLFEKFKDVNTPLVVPLDEVINKPESISAINHSDLFQPNEDIVIVRGDDDKVIDETKNIKLFQPFDNSVKESLKTFTGIENNQQIKYNVEKKIRWTIEKKAHPACKKIKKVSSIVSGQEKLYELILREDSGKPFKCAVLIVNDSIVKGSYSYNEIIKHAIYRNAIEQAFQFSHSNTTISFVLKITDIRDSIILCVGPEHEKVSIFVQLLDITKVINDMPKNENNMLLKKITRNFGNLVNRSIKKQPTVDENPKDYTFIAPLSPLPPNQLKDNLAQPSAPPLTPFNQPHYRPPSVFDNSNYERTRHSRDVHGKHNSVRGFVHQNNKMNLNPPSPKQNNSDNKKTNESQPQNTSSSEEKETSENCNYILPVALSLMPLVGYCAIYYTCSRNNTKRRKLDL